MHFTDFNKTYLCENEGNYIYKIVVRIYLEFKIYIGIFQFEEGGGP